MSKQVVSFVLLILLTGLCIGAMSQAPAPKEDRLSGVVNSIDEKAKAVEIHMRKQTSVVRTIVYSDSTKWTLDGKPAKPSDAKAGLRIVGVGKYEGVKLNANVVALYAK